MACTLVHTELFRFEKASLITLRAEQDECPASGMFWASAGARSLQAGVENLNLHRAVNVRRTASFQPAYFCSRKVLFMRGSNLRSRRHCAAKLSNSGQIPAVRPAR